MILDLIIIVIFVPIVLTGVSKGAARMIFGLLMSFAAFLAASWLGRLLAGVIYDSFAAPAVGSAVKGSVENTLQGLPGWAQRALQLSGRDISPDASDVSQAIDAAVQPIIVGFIAILLTIVLFIIISLILHKLVLPGILSAFRTKFTSAVDKLLGGFFGALEAIVVIWMLAYILKLVLPYIDSDVSFLNERTIYNSFIFYHFYSGNIFTVLASWIG